MKRLKEENTQQVVIVASSVKAQFILTAYQGLMLAIILSVLIGHGEAF